jgi:hypothetical protein
MFTEPAIESAGDAGVGTLVTSMRDTLLIETWLNSYTRELPAALPVFASSAPSLETTARLPGNPRTEIDATEPPDSEVYSAVMPGMNFRNSPTLPSIRSPSASAATTFLMFGAKRCSLTAIASPSVSRPDETVNASSFTTRLSP